MSDKNLHKGHRERLRQRFCYEGAMGMCEHEVLELILFYCIPRQNTNDISHRLINKFGSLPAVLEAKPEELVTVKGISEASANFLKFVSDVRKYYNEYYVNSIKLLSFEVTNDFFIDYFSANPDKELIIVSVDNSFEVKRIFDFSYRAVITNNISVREIAELLIQNECKTIIVGINHKNNPPVPSNGDYSVIKKFSENLKRIDIEVYDCVICGMGGGNSMRQTGAFSFYSI